MRQPMYDAQGRRLLPSFSDNQSWVQQSGPLGRSDGYGGTYSLGFNPPWALYPGEYVVKIPPGAPLEQGTADIGWGTIDDRPTDSGYFTKLQELINAHAAVPAKKDINMVDHPPHYTQGSGECIEAIQSALSPEEYIGFLRGQVMKYVWHLNQKDEPLENVKKARWYLNKLIGLYEEPAE